MALICFTFVIPDNVDPVFFASGFDRQRAFEENVATSMTVDYKIPHKQAWRTVAIECDTCGDLVDQRTDPSFRNHNEVNHQRHKRLVLSNPNYPNVPRVF